MSKVIWPVPTYEELKRDTESVGFCVGDCGLDRCKECKDYYIETGLEYAEKMEEKNRLHGIGK